MLLGILSYQSINDHHLGFSDPYIRIKCHILIKVLQLFGTPFQQLLRTHEIFHIVLPTSAVLIPDSMSIFQTNAGNNILTLSKLHIRAIHHALSEIGTKRWISYQGIAIKRNYRGQKLLVESSRKHGFDLKTFISISNYSSSLRRYRGITFPLMSRQIQFDGGDTTCFSPLTTTGISLATSNSHPSTEGIFTSSRMSCRREIRSFGTVLLKAQPVILSFYKFHSVLHAMMT